MSILLVIYIILDLFVGIIYLLTPTEGLINYIKSTTEDEYNSKTLELATKHKILTFIFIVFVFGLALVIGFILDLIKIIHNLIFKTKIEIKK